MTSRVQFLDRSLDWHERAACNGADPARFAPKWQTNGRLPDDAYLTAHNYCRPCPVRELCEAQRKAEGEGAVGLIWAGRLVSRKSNDSNRISIHDLLKGGSR